MDFVINESDIVLIPPKVKIFEESHEKDLEDKINELINKPNIAIIDIKYQVAIAISNDGDQIFSFSALVAYKEEKNQKRG